MSRRCDKIYGKKIKEDEVLIANDIKVENPRKNCEKSSDISL